MTAMRGVNLGGWLVLERWMTPSLFDGLDAVDHHTFMQTPGARAKLREHEKNFIREEDFKWIKSHGIEAVRIPVGYWIIDGDGPYVSSIGRLDWAFRMAKKYDLRVLLCLHGAPGSQNGHDHSGQVGKALWYREKQYRERTIDVLMQLASRYRDESSFWGLELLNEPKIGVFQFKLRRFYNNAYRSLIRILHPSTRIVFHDAFTPRMLSAAIWDVASHPLTMDIHWYHFTYWAYKWTPLAWYYRLVRWHGRLATALQRWQGVIIGEWSGALDGRAVKTHQTRDHHTVELEHVRLQLEAYAGADAWFYWNYKVEYGGTWSFRSLIDDDRILLPE